MYIEKNGGGYSLADEKSDSSLAEFCGGAIEVNGKEIALEVSESSSSRGEIISVGEQLTITDRISDMGDGLFKICRTLKNDWKTKRVLKLIFTIKTVYEPTRYLIPCVNYDGNKWGDGNYPKGLYRDGQAWIYSYDRESIPSCSHTENEGVFMSVFVSDENDTSLVSSVSLTDNSDGTYNHRIYWPVTEAPYSYTDTNVCSPRYDTYMTLEPREEKTFDFYVFVGAPMWKNFGFANTLDRAMEIFKFDRAPEIKPEKVWELGIAYAKKLIQSCRGKKLMVTGMHCNLGAEKFIYDVQHYEIGFCGQNILNCRMFILEYMKNGDKKLLDDALEILDNWAARQAENGLILAHYEWYPEVGEWKPEGDGSTILASDKAIFGKGWYPECCNVGWGAAEFAKTYAQLKAIGIDKPEYLRFATRVCDFFCEKYSDKYGFGRAWDFDGNLVNGEGSVGDFIIPALLDTWRVTKNEKYLEFAKRGLEFYIRRDIDNFECTAGAIDCACIDKETSYPLVLTSLDLYDITHEEKYLEWAKKSAYYFFSYTYHYDCVYPDDADFSRYGYYTTGGTFVSAQHHALDSWGSLLVPEYLRLYKITGDEKWYTRARMMWCNSILCIPDKEGIVINGTPRPLGGQNEAFFQCRWTRYRPSPETRGHFNNWLVSWVNAYRMSAIDKMSYELHEKNLDMLS